MKKLFLLLSFLTTTAPQPTLAIDNTQVDCVSSMAWSEARGEPKAGMLATTYTVVNRQRWYPSTPCHTVHSPHQYTFMKVPSGDKPKVDKQTLLVLNKRVSDPSRGATSFDVPSAINRIKHYGGYDLVRIGNHIYYKDPRFLKRVSGTR
jgi:spore germination cell wall hydrolase CwlJ-like protein